MNKLLGAVLMSVVILISGCNSSNTDKRRDKVLQTFKNDQSSEKKLKTLLCGKSWYAVLDKKAQGVTVFGFNHDCTVLNEGTEDEAQITISGNKMFYVGNRANYTEFETEYGKYIFAYNKYVGVAKAKAWFYQNKKDAQNFLKNN